MRSCRSWGYIATVIIGLVLVSVALAERLTTFSWAPEPSWPSGTTIEFCGNGPTCLSGLTGLSATMSLPVNPGEVIQGMARAIPPPVVQCGEPLAECPPSEWATIAQTWPAAPVAPWAWKKEIVAVADPTYQNSGTVYHSGSTSVTSASTTITNVSVGDLLVVQVIRDAQSQITGVASTSPALTFARQVRADSASAGYSQDIYTAIATDNASSMTITASYSGSDNYASIVSHRWSSGVSSATVTHSAADTALRATSTNRTVPNITTTARTLLLVSGADWDAHRTHTAASGWTKIIDGASSSFQYLNAQIADAGTYPNGNFATTSATDRYFGSIIALPVDTSGGATALPRRALDGPFYGALRGSVR